MKLATIIVLPISVAFCSSSSHAQENTRIASRGLAVMEAKGKFHPHEFTRRPAGDDDDR